MTLPPRPSAEQMAQCNARIGHRWEPRKVGRNIMRLRCVDCSAGCGVTRSLAFGPHDTTVYYAHGEEERDRERPPCPATQEVRT